MSMRLKNNAPIELRFNIISRIRAGLSEFYDKDKTRFYGYCTSMVWAMDPSIIAQIAHLNFTK